MALFHERASRVNLFPGTAAAAGMKLCVVCESRRPADRPLKLDSVSRRLITAAKRMSRRVSSETRGAVKRPLPERLSRPILSRYIISYGPGARFSTFVHGHGTRRPWIHVNGYLFNNNMYNVYP